MQVVQGGVLFLLCVHLWDVDVPLEFASMPWRSCLPTLSSARGSACDCCYVQSHQAHFRTCRAIRVTTQHLSLTSKASRVLAPTPLSHQLSCGLLLHIFTLSLVPDFSHAVPWAWNAFPCLTHLAISKKIQIAPSIRRNALVCGTDSQGLLFVYLIEVNITQHKINLYKVHSIQWHF